MFTGMESYNNGTKNNWRRRIWNEATIRMRQANIEIKNARVLYLCGPDNIDGKIAIEKGFKPWNLYAVEREKKKIMKLRKKGVNVINEDLNLIIDAWKGKEKIEFLFADFCGGLHKDAYSLAMNLLLSNIFAPKCIIAANFFRGRDKFLPDSWDILFENLDKHRGKMFYRLIYTLMMRFLVKTNTHTEWTIVKRKELIRDLNNLTDNWARPSHYSYRTEKNNYMDSIIFNWGTLINFSATQEKIWSGRVESVDIKNDVLVNSGIFVTPESYYDGTEQQKKVRSKISAAKAINTMRHTGRLPLRANGI